MYTHNIFGEGEIERKYHEIFLGAASLEKYEVSQVYRLYEEKLCIFGATLVAVAQFDLPNDAFMQRAITQQSDMLRLGSEYARTVGQAQVEVTEIKDGDPLFDIDYYRLRLGSDSYSADQILRFGYKAIGKTIEIIPQETATPATATESIDELAQRRLTHGKLMLEPLQAIAGQ